MLSKIESFTGQDDQQENNYLIVLLVLSTVFILFALAVQFNIFSYLVKPDLPHQDQTNSVIVSGKVINYEGGSIEEAKVMIENRRVEDINRDGVFSFRANNSQEKDYLELNIKKEGFLPEKRLVYLNQSRSQNEIFLGEIKLTNKSHILLNYTIQENQGFSKGKNRDVWYLTTQTWEPIRHQISYDDRKRSVRVSYPADREKVRFNFLWTVPGFGEIMAYVDLNQSDRGKDLLPLLAETHFNQLEREIKKNNYSQRTENLYQSAKNYFNRSIRENGSFNGDLTQKSLNYTFWGLESLALDKAQENIERNRRGNFTVNLSGGNKEGLKNISVGYELVEPEFKFGVTGFRSDNKTQDRIRELGFNLAGVFGFWHETEPEDNQFNFSKVKNDFNSIGNISKAYYGLIGDSPSYLSEYNLNKLQEEVEEHVSTTLQEFEGINYWECYGLGMHRMADTTLQMTKKRNKKSNVNSTKICIKKVNNKGKKPILTGWNIDSRQINYYNYTESPYQYFKKLKRENLSFDLSFDFAYFGSAHEIYPELQEKGVYDIKSGDRRENTNWVPVRDLYTFSQLLDKYSDLNRSIHIPYFNAPSNYLNDSLGFWHSPWDQKVQAEWIRKYYTIVYSKPWVKSISYLELRDRDWKRLKTGLLGSEGDPKQSYRVLKQQLGNWSTSGNSKIGIDGQFKFEGFKGTYNLSISYQNNSYSELVEFNQSKTKEIELNLLN